MTAVGILAYRYSEPEIVCDAYFQSMLGENTVVTKKPETKDPSPLKPKIFYSWLTNMIV